MPAPGTRGSPSGAFGLSAERLPMKELHRLTGLESEMPLAHHMRASGTACGPGGNAGDHPSFLERAATEWAASSIRGLRDKDTSPGPST